MENRDEVIRAVRAQPGLSEVAEVTTFSAVRTTSKGVPRVVTIQVHDRGPGGPGGRYVVVVTDERGRRASGNGHEQLSAAIAIVHWEDLDKD